MENQQNIRRLETYGCFLAVQHWGPEVLNIDQQAESPISREVVGYCWSIHSVYTDVHAYKETYLYWYRYSFNINTYADVEFITFWFLSR